MEKKLLMVFAVALCISSADAATVYMQRKNPSMKMQAQQSKAIPQMSPEEAMAMHKVTNTIEGVQIQIDNIKGANHGLSTTDAQNLVLALGTLISHGKSDRSASKGLTGNALLIFNTVYDAVSSIKNMKLDPGSAFEFSKDVVNGANGIIAHYYFLMLKQGVTALKK